MRTAESAIEVAVAQMRDGEQPFRSSLMGFLDGNSEMLERLVCELYARRLSTRHAEGAFCDATGQPLIFKSAVSEITDRLWEGKAFISRDLSEIAVAYLAGDNKESRTVDGCCRPTPGQHRSPQNQPTQGHRCVIKKDVDL